MAIIRDGFPGLKFGALLAVPIGIIYGCILINDFSEFYWILLGTFISIIIGFIFGYLLEGTILAFCFLTVSLYSLSIISNEYIPCYTPTGGYNPLSILFIIGAIILMIFSIAVWKVSMSLFFSLRINYTLFIYLYGIIGAFISCNYLYSAFLYNRNVIMGSIIIMVVIVPLLGYFLYLLYLHFHKNKGRKK